MEKKISLPQSFAVELHMLHDLKPGGRMSRFLFVSLPFLCATDKKNKKKMRKGGKEFTYIKEKNELHFFSVSKKEGQVGATRCAVSQLMIQRGKKVSTLYFAAAAKYIAATYGCRFFVVSPSSFSQPSVWLASV